jgi:hypothetical protein
MRPFGWHGYCQPFAPFGTAALEYIASTGGLHAGKKTMRSFSSYVAGLIGSFHRNNAPSGRQTAK